MMANTTQHEEPDRQQSSQSSPRSTQHILFLTTDPATPHNHSTWNAELLPALAARSTRTTLLSYLDPTSKSLTTPAHLASTYTHISLLLVGHYPPHYSALLPLLNHTLPAAAALNPSLRMYPGLKTAVWNADKSYLCDLRDAGFPVPRTNVLSPRQSLEDVKRALAGTSHGAGAVVKPSVGASGGWTHFIQHPGNLSDGDEAFLRDFVRFARDGGGGGGGDGDGGFAGSIMLQEYIPEIRDGEYSLCFVGGSLLYTVLKRPRNGGWQVNSEHGGSYAVVPDADVPASAREVAHQVVEWLQHVRFADEELAYARIDGVVRKGGQFVLMEVELIEPSLFLDMQEHGVGSKGVGALCELFCR